MSLEIASLAALHARRSWKWAGQPVDVLPMTVAEMDFPIAEPIKAALHAAIDRDDLGYPPPGTPSLTGAFVDFAARRLNWEVDPDQVVLVPDVLIGVLALARLLAGADGSVAVAAPAYRPFLTDPSSVGLAVRRVPTDEAGKVDVAAVERHFANGTRVFVLVNPHNPTGRVARRDELQELAELAERYEAWVIADEIHAPLVLPGATHVPWLEVSDAARERGFALTSASKAFNLAGLKVAQLVTASTLARAVAGRLRPWSEHTGLLGVVTAEVAFAECDQWLDAVLDQLDANRALLHSLLVTELPTVRWTRPDAGYLAWLDCEALELGEDPARLLLERGRLAIAAGRDYGGGAGHLRLNFGTSPALISEAVRRMKAAVGGHLFEPTRGQPLA